MRLWTGQLTKSDVAELAALAPEITAAVDEADLAVKTHDALEQQRTFFREAGDRKKFFNDLNAVRKETYGALGKLPFQHRGLPSRFADLFFLHEKPRGKEEVTMESVQASINDLTQQLDARQALLEKLAAEEELEKKKAAELEAKKAVAAQLEREADEADQQAKAKRAQIAELNLQPEPSSHRLRLKESAPKESIDREIESLLARAAGSLSTPPRPNTAMHRERAGLPRVGESLKINLEGRGQNGCRTAVHLGINRPENASGACHYSGCAAFTRDPGNVQNRSLGSMNDPKDATTPDIRR